MLSEELKQKLYDTGFNNEGTYGGCSQGVLGSVKTNLGHVTEETFTAATALAGGVAASGNTCGACTGGILALGSFLGRDFENFGTPEGLANKERATAIGRKLLERFEKEYGSFTCAEIQKKLFGKSYKMYIPEEKAEFIACGGHGPNGCTKTVANAAVWVAEILEEEGLLD
ncbi:C-GCAxxG-C-C family protein [Lachnospiraceae bacterium NSJ-143]|nr:C-GCAxxG-C-C family protein [Lachnospiraceae bacterium NSJ-143]